jgi:NAD(P)-dependent dehydrogenase (short-subunit alcohol dehydrogenase family)
VAIDDPHERRHLRELVHRPKVGDCCAARKDQLRAAGLQPRAGPPHGERMKLSNAVVLITGANRGLGAALVQRSLAAGARRVYAGARDPSQLAAAVRAAPDRIVPLALDVTDPASIAAAAARAPDVSVLINNAGVLASFGVLTATTDAVARDFAVNLFGMIATTRAWLPALERAAQAGDAGVINVLSIVSFASMPAFGGYSASKAAAYSVTQSLRNDLAGKRIAVHAAFPGPIDTDMVRDMEMPKTSPDDVAAAILGAVERGVDEILPDATARELHAIWKQEPRALERQFVKMAGG